MICLGRAYWRARVFSLIEVLLALVISMLVIGSLAGMFYSFVHAWLGARDHGHLDDHEQGVVTFFEFEFGRLKGLGSDDRIGWRPLPGSGPYDPDFLSWPVRKPPPFLQVPPQFSGVGVRFYLRFERNQGLSLIWHPEDDLLVDPWRDEPLDLSKLLYEVAVSAEVRDLVYAFYDLEKDTWEDAATPWKDQNLKGQIPDVIQLVFGEEDAWRRHSLYLPRVMGAAGVGSDAEGGQLGE